MNLKRQLLLVSLLTLMLPWAGCEFIRETEGALRSVQQQMLEGTAQAIANSLAQYVEEFPPIDYIAADRDRLYLHDLGSAPTIDGYFDDWPLTTASIRSLQGPDGVVSVAAGIHEDDAYLYVEVSDRNVVYASAQTMILDDGPRYADRVTLLSQSPPFLDERLIFAAEAPGAIVGYRQDQYGFEPVHRIRAHWQDIPGGYRVEARIPFEMLGANLGLVVRVTDSADDRGVHVQSFEQSGPGPVARALPDLRAIAGDLTQPGMRLTVTDAFGWRVATAGELAGSDSAGVSGWGRIIYSLIMQSGEESELAEPDPRGRESQAYVRSALDGDGRPAWFRGESNGTAVVAFAAPVISNGEVIGAVMLQQGTDAILSLTNQRLSRLIYFTLITTLVVAGSLLGYATWLSRRIRHLSLAAEDALASERLHEALPSAASGDEIGALSRSFSRVLGQLGDYNTYLRTLASKLSHELRTPLTIVTSSLENLEHESLGDAAAGYVGRARDGADRLRHILSAMSEASRVEELMESAEPELFDLRVVLESTTTAYRDAWPNRRFVFDSIPEPAFVNGSPELLIQMLDKLIDNAVGFSEDGETIRIAIRRAEEDLVMTVMNPGPSLPQRMQRQMFDSMVSMRHGDDSRHLGLGLYIAKLIAEGHEGSISARNVDGGVEFAVSLPRSS